MNVIQIGDFRVTRKREASTGDCKHYRFTINAQGDFVTCDDCKTRISPSWALSLLCDSYVAETRRLESAQGQVKAVADKALHLKAAQRVEEAWRSRTMVPTCPHCGDAIFPQDGFGSSRINRAMAQRRRDAKTER